MSFRFEIILAINILQTGFLWALWRMLKRLEHVQDEAMRMVGGATRDLVDRSQDLYQLLDRLEERKPTDW